MTVNNEFMQEQVNILIKNDVKDDDGKKPDDEKSNVGIIIMFIVVALVLVIGVAFVIRKKRLNKTQDEYNSVSDSENLNSKIINKSV